MEDEVRVAITTDADLVTARAEGRAMAERLGFPRPDPTLIATAIIKRTKKEPCSKRQRSSGGAGDYRRAFQEQGGTQAKAPRSRRAAQVTRITEFILKVHAETPAAPRF